MDKFRNYWGEDLAKYYDTIVDSGYYDYDRDVSIIKSILGYRTRILELGCGTANIVIKLTEAGFEVDGIEPSNPMFKIAKEKIKKRDLNIGLFQQDVRNLNLSKTYDGVFSHGGVPVYIMAKTGLEFESYLETIEENKQMLKRVYDILENDGLFLVSIHAEHTDSGEFHFGDNLRYFPKVKFDGDIIEKTHCICKGDEPIVEQKFYQRRFKKELIEIILEKIGFQIIGQKPENLKMTKTIDTGGFYVLKK